MAQPGPLKVWRANGVEVSIWNNDMGVSSASVSKRYKDKDGQYKSSTVWRAEDLLVLSEFAKQAALEMVRNDWQRGKRIAGD